MDLSSTCQSCQNARNSFMCQPCLSKLLKLYRKETKSHHEIHLPAAKARARTGINLLKENRELEAVHWMKEQVIRDVRGQLGSLTKEIGQDNEELQKRREYLRSRKQRLQAARELLQQSTSTVPQALAASNQSHRQAMANSAQGTSYETWLTNQHHTVLKELASTRRILLGEVIEALDVRPSVSPGCRYEIASLPVPSLRETLPKHQLNAIVPTLIQFMRLVVFYLDVKLPFTIGGTLIKALIRVTGGNSNAAKFPKTYPLYASSGSSSSTSKGNPQGIVTSALESASPSTNTATAASHAHALSIGLKMLAYNARYLLHIAEGSDAPRRLDQADDDPLDILCTLVAVCRSPESGKRSHRLFNSPDALQDTEWPGQDFASFLEAVEKRSTQRSADNRAPGKSRGTYVVVDGKAKNKERTPIQREDSMDPFVVGKDEDGWDIL